MRANGASHCGSSWSAQVRGSLPARPGVDTGVLAAWCVASPCCATRSSWSAQVRGSLPARPGVDTGVLSAVIGGTSCSREEEEGGGEGGGMKSSTVLKFHTSRHEIVLESRT